MGVIRWLERFGTDGRAEAAMESAARAFSDTTDSLTRASFMKEDIGWYDPSGRASDLVPLSVIEEHSIRSRRLATYNTIVKRGINIQSLSRWRI